MPVVEALTSWRRYSFSRMRRVVRSTRSITTSSASAVHGLSSTSDAPALMAWTAVSTVPCAVIITDGTPGTCSRILLISSTPSMPGMRRSASTRSGAFDAARSSASAPFLASIGL